MFNDLGGKRKEIQGTIIFIFNFFNMETLQDYVPAQEPAVTVLNEHTGIFFNVNYNKGDMDLSYIEPGRNFKVTCPVEDEEEVKLLLSKQRDLGFEYAFVKYSVTEKGEMLSTLYFCRPVEA